MTCRQFAADYGRTIAALQSNPALRASDSWPYGRTPARRPPDPLELETVRARRARTFPFDDFLYCGFGYPNGRLSAVLYRPDRITFVRLADAQSALISYEFSGCYLAKFRFRTAWYGAHIATAEAAAHDRKTLWMDFLRTYASDISALAMIRPSAERALFEETYRLRRLRRRVTLAGLFDGTHRGYSIVYDFERCAVADDDDNNIRVAHKELLAHPADRTTYLLKTI